MDFIRLYEEIYKLLPSGNIQQLVQVCYELTGVPILVVDIMYNVLGIAPDAPIDDELWDHLQMNRGFTTEQIAGLYRDGILQSADKMNAPYIVDWGSSKNKPKIQGVIRINNNIEGYVTMSCAHAEITEERLRAMDIIMHVCSYFFKQNGSESSMKFSFQKVFAGELFNNRIKTEKQLKTWFYDMGCEYPPPYYICAVSSANCKEKNILSYLRKSVQILQPQQVMLIQDNILYILHYGTEAFEGTANNETFFIKTLCQFDAQCGISNPFDSLLDVPNYKKQAIDALMIGLKMDPKNQVFYYKDYTLPAILLPRVEEMCQENYVPITLKEMEAYDLENSTEFLTTLKCYISNLLNTANTAKALHIHRNTLFYRINRIEELFQLSLKDQKTFLHLMIAFNMMDLEGLLQVKKQSDK